MICSNWRNTRAAFPASVARKKNSKDIAFARMCCNENMIPVLLIMTSNAPDYGYQELLRNYQQTLSRFVGPTEVFVSGDTLQIKDYSKTDWPWYFDGEAKHKRHETVFPEECRKVYELGIELAE